MKRIPQVNSLLVVGLLALAGLFSFSAIPPADVSAQANVPNLSGTWIGFYDDGSKSPYVWAISQTGSTLAIQNVGGKTAKSTGRVAGNKVVAEEFATQNGTLSDDGARIKWSDGVVWQRLTLNGFWVGYYDDGTKSPYVWDVRQTGSTLAIVNVGGDPAKSKGRVAGNKVVAEDFATQNGTLSADGSQIKWTDGVVWKRLPNLGGTWIGYYNDGSKSPYVWSISQVVSDLLIENVGGNPAKSRGRVDGKTVFAQDFSTKNGTLSDDGSRIKWTDGVVWVKQ
jgi:hypothetical protein